MTTITRDTRNCWCRSVRQQGLIGATVRASDLPGITAPSGPLVRVTDQDHATRPDGAPRCWLVIDGWQRWPIHATDGADTLTVETSDEPTSLDTRLREPIRHDGPMTLGQAGDLVSQITGRYTLAGMQIPVRPGGSAKIRRAFTPRPPAAPQTAQSYYTRGRVRRVPESGLWAADQGWAGTTRSLGEHETQAEAEAAVRDAIDRAWTRLEEWMQQYVHGDWQLVHLPIEEIEVQDRVNTAQAAEMAGVADSTWRGYVARGQAPAPDGHDGKGWPWWHRVTVETWMEGRRGQGWRRGLARTGDGGES